MNLANMIRILKYFVNDDEGHECIGIKFDVLKDKYFLHGKVQPIVIRLIGSLK